MFSLNPLLCVSSRVRLENTNFRSVRQSSVITSDTSQRLELSPHLTLAIDRETPTNVDTPSRANTLARVSCIFVRFVRQTNTGSLLLERGKIFHLLRA